MTMRLQIAKVCFMLSSIFRALGKLVVPKEKSIVCDVLTLPGWFILHDCIIYQKAMDGKGLRNGFEWVYWSMPDKWCEQMNELKKKSMK